MTTRAFLKDLSLCKSLRSECCALIEVAKIEINNSYKPLKPAGIGNVGFVAITLICALWLTPVVVDSAISFGNVFASLFLGLVGGVFTWLASSTNAANNEVSDNIYHQLTVLRLRYKDLDGLRQGGVPLSLADLLRHLHDLVDALDSDMSRPSRTAFQYNPDEKVKLFEFNHCIDDE